MSLTLHILEQEARRAHAALQAAAYYHATLALGHVPRGGLIVGAPSSAPPQAALFFAPAAAAPRMGTFSTQPPTPVPSPPSARFRAPAPIDVPLLEPVPHHAVGQLAPVEFEQFEGISDARWDEPVDCPVCAKKCPSKYQTKKHYMRKHYTGIKRHRCTRCDDKAYAMREDLTTHLKSCGVVYPCETCGAKLGSRETLVRHCRRTSHAMPPKRAAASSASTTSAPSATTSSIVEVPDAGPLAHTGPCAEAADASVDAALLLCDGPPLFFGELATARTAQSHGAPPPMESDDADDDDDLYAALEKSIFCVGAAVPSAAAAVSSEARFWLGLDRA